MSVILFRAAEGQVHPHLCGQSYLPQPPMIALAVPMQFLLKNTEVHTWYGMKVTPRIPMKNLNM